MSKRVFRLQFSESNLYQCTCGFCSRLGLISPYPKAKEDYERSIEKLSYDLIDKVFVPCFAPKITDFATIEKTLKDRDKKIIICNDKKTLVVTDNVLELDDDVDNILVLNKKLLKSKNTFSKLNSFKGAVYFYAPRKKCIFDESLSLRKIYKFLIKLKKNNIEFQVYPGLSLWEDRAPIDICFEPASNLGIKSAKTKKLSVIIPVFEQKSYLINTLNALSEQSLSENDFEVIVIDDGGSDQLAKEMTPFYSKLDLKYEYFPRAIKRTMGDFRFRAGISRNLGYRISCGETLFFLDADVLLPKNALETVLNEIKECDLLQIQRLDLTKEATMNRHSIESITDSDIISRGRDYWYNFFKMAKVDWNNLNDPWKYVCTYGLIVSREDFSRLGGFNNNYIGYGFEDTDLGLRMKKNGANFKLSKVVSYHQFHSKERSEFRNAHYTRKKILSRTAKTFFLNQLDPDVYRCLKDYM